MKTIPLWQLQARGSRLRLEGFGQINSKRLFGSKAAAEAFIPEFRRRCVTPLSEMDFAVLEDSAGLEIRIVEFELQGDL
jgi:hypothetical protein